MTPIIEATFISLNDYHRFFSLCFALPFVANLIILFAYQNKMAILVRRMWFVTPLIIFLLAVSILSGINVFLFSAHTGAISLNLSILAMIVFCLFIIIGEIYRFKMLKIARRTSLEAMLKYVAFCKILYIIDLLFFIFVFFLS